MTTPNATATTISDLVESKLQAEEHRSDAAPTDKIEEQEQEKGEKSIDATKIRNICVIAHVDHGKTSLTDSLISSNGIISARLAGKLRYMDSREDEQTRGITMKTSAISLSHVYSKDERRKALINLVDSPGHVDFSGEVDVALRVCDGAVLLVDVGEGVCVQTISVLRAALYQHVKPILVLNKVDRLMTELHMTPEQAYRHMYQLIEQVNVILGMRAAEVMFEKVHLEAAERKTDDGAEHDEAREVYQDDQAFSRQSNPSLNEEEEFRFSPEKGNVIFASAADGWAFRIDHFARLYSTKFGIREEALRQTLWGEYYLNAKTKKILKGKAGGLNSKARGTDSTPMFAQMILSNIWKLYDIIQQGDIEKRENIVHKLEIKVSPRDVKHRDSKVALQAIMSSWIPLARTVLDAVLDCLPDPRQGQNERLPIIWNYPEAVPPLSETPEALAEQQEKAVQSWNLQKTAIQACSASRSRPMIAYVAKMVTMEATTARGKVSMPKPREKEAQDSSASPGANGTPEVSTTPSEAKQETVTSFRSTKERTKIVVGFVRVLSGMLKVGDQIHVYGPRYNPSKLLDDQENMSHHSVATVNGLYFLMGKDMENVSQVDAGFICAVSGLDQAVLKTATLCSLAPGECLPLTMTIASLAATRASASMVRVAIEPYNPAEMQKLQEGLKKLNQADPVVETYVMSTGEHVICANGELHLERCLKDLREDYARIRLHVSPPLVSFRETICGEKFGFYTNSLLSPYVRLGKEVMVKLPNGVCVTIHAGRLPTRFAAFLEAQSVLIRDKLASLSSYMEKMKLFQTELYKSLKEDSEHGELGADEEAGYRIWKEQILPRIWAFGPRKFGPNAIFGPVQFGQAQTEIARIILGLVAPPSPQTSESMDDIDLVDEKRLEIERSLLSGFQMAASAGPLCEEPMYGMAFFISSIRTLQDGSKAENYDSNYDGKDEDEDHDGNSSEPDKNFPDQDHNDVDDRQLVASLEHIVEAVGVRNYVAARSTGQLIPLCRDAFRKALLDGGPRLMEAMFQVDIQASMEALSTMYGVIAQRRGRVIREDMKEGTSVFLVTALVPVTESFGFTDYLRKQTSGAASPQVSFSHWEALEQDPFWTPTTEEELEDLGKEDSTEANNNLARKLVSKVRRRKGLRVDEKIVEKAEKQRTLAKKK